MKDLECSIIYKMAVRLYTDTRPLGYIRVRAGHVTGPSQSKHVLGLGSTMLQIKSNLLFSNKKIERQRGP